MKFTIISLLTFAELKSESQGHLKFCGEIWVGLTKTLVKFGRMARPQVIECSPSQASSFTVNIFNSYGRSEQVFAINQQPLIFRAISTQNDACDRSFKESASAISIIAAYIVTLSSDQLATNLVIATSYKRFSNTSLPLLFCSAFSIVLIEVNPHNPSVFWHCLVLIKPISLATLMLHTPFVFFSMEISKDPFRLNISQHLILLTVETSCYSIHSSLTAPST